MAITQHEDGFNTFPKHVLVSLMLVTLCEGAQITAVTSGYNDKSPVYTAIDAETTRELVFKTKGPQTVYVGLTSQKFSVLRNNLIYEIIIGAWAGLRKKGAGDVSTILVKNDTGTSFLSDAVYRTFWLTWANSRIKLGFGAVFGEQIIFNTDVTNIGYSIKFLAFHSNRNGDSYSIYYDAQPTNVIESKCGSSCNFPQFLIGATTNDDLHDNDTNTCLDIPSGFAGHFIQFKFLDVPPLQVLLTLKSESCTGANIVVFDYFMTECPLISADTDAGMSECVYKCSPSSTQRITVGFERTPIPRTWSLCEIAELRNKYKKKMHSVCPHNNLNC